jgi:hypothetical protein
MRKCPAGFEKGVTKKGHEAIMVPRRYPTSFGRERSGAPAISCGVALKSSMWSVMLGVSGMRLETAFPGV